MHLLLLVGKESNVHFAAITLTAMSDYDHVLWELDLVSLADRRNSASYNHFKQTFSNSWHQWILDKYILRDIVLPLLRIIQSIPPRINQLKYLLI